jgi:polyhydroxyalkanoate synthase
VLRHGASPLLPEMADQLWRANPLHRLLPISWGEITRALVTLSARSMADPVHATTAAANLGLTMWREAAEIWIGTAARWWGLAPAAPARPGSAEADRRFDAPESPTSFLPTNPAALRKAWETGGGSVAHGSATCWTIFARAGSA